MFLKNITIICCLSLLLVSCNKEVQLADKQPSTEKIDGSYFSIKQFTRDQWDMLQGLPIMLEKTAALNGKTDSSLVSIFDVDWGAIMKIFFETDISNPKFVGKYNFSTFEESSTSTMNFYYQAKDKSLFTQTLQISMDEFTNGITNIYIETHQHSIWNDKTQKLYYHPKKLLQIQEYESPLFGSKKALHVEYRFLL